MEVLGHFPSLPLLTFMVLDIGWLGLVARDFYDGALGSLKRPAVYWPAAFLFYAMYVTAIVLYAVRTSHTCTVSLRRGAALGWVAYSTYELTNWAVIRDWPAEIVAIDILWGMALTAASAGAGYTVYRSGDPRRSV